MSEVLTESKQRYPHYQKIAYGVFLASRKLRHYFQEHPITVVSKTPLSDIINKSNATGRVAKWGIKLAAFENHLQETQRYQVTSLGGFYCILDGDAGCHSVARTRVLGDAL